MLHISGDPIITRRQFLRLSGTVLAGTAVTHLLAACGGGEAAPAADPGSQAGGQAAQPKEGTQSFASATAATADDAPVAGGNLTFVHESIPTSLDANVWTSRFAARIMRQLYDPLVWQPTGGEFVPGLAESWEISEDGLEYTFSLRRDVTLTDGTPFTAEDVRYTWHRMLDPETKSLQVGRLGEFDRAEVVDEYTVKAHLRNVMVVFLNNVSEVGLSPGSRTQVEKMGSGYPKFPCGAGSFRVKEWPDENTLVIERYPDYAWAPSFMKNQGTAYLDTVTYRFVEEAATRLLALESGEADVIDAPPPGDVQWLLTSDEYVSITTVVPGLPQVANINVSRPPTSDLAVRQAMLYGVDREAGAMLMFEGAQPPAHGPLASSSWGYWDGVEAMYPYDPDRAEQLLDEAGWVRGSDGVREKDGQRLTVRHVTTTGEAQRFAEFIQGSLNPLGFDYVVEAMAYEATASRYADNEYELARLGLAQPDPHDPFYSTFHSSQIEGGGQFNRSRVEDSKIDDLIARGSATNDIAERTAVYRELQQYIMEQALILPGWETVLYHVLQPHVQDFRVEVVGQPFLHDVWLKT